MSWNRFIQTISRVVGHRRGPFHILLLTKREKHKHLFGKYSFEMDLALGFAQKMFFLKPDVYERDTQRALRQLIGPGMTVMDIGANSGYMTLLMADLVGPSGKVFAFEPASRLFALLAVNVHENVLPQVSIFQLALSDKVATAVLHIDPGNDGANSLAGGGYGNTEEQVRLTTLDLICEEQGVASVDVIKIDVEGAETLVFAGASQLLSRSDAPTIVCEVSDANQARFGKTERDLRLLLKAYGYRSFRERDFSELNIDAPVRGLRNVVFSKRDLAQRQ